MSSVHFLQKDLKGYFSIGRSFWKLRHFEIGTVTPYCKGLCTLCLSFWCKLILLLFDIEGNKKRESLVVVIICVIDSFPYVGKD